MQTITANALFAILIGCAFSAASQLDAGEPTMGRRLSATDLKVATGEWWYAMNDEEGKPMGYCHYTTNTVADGSVRVEWQLRLAFPGGTYEEDRSMDMDGSLRMKAASYAAGGATCAGARDGKRITVTRKAPQGAEGTTVPVTPPGCKWS